MGATLSVEDQFEGDDSALLKRIQELLDVRMKDKRKRYVHSLGVAETALHLAEVYGVDRFDAAAAGLIHDWVHTFQQVPLQASLHRCKSLYHLT